MLALHWLYYVLLLAAQLAGLFLNILGLPGLWVMVAAAALYGWATGWAYNVGWWTLGTLVGLGLLAEAIEFLAGAAGAKSAGGSKRGMIGAVTGALVGGIAGSFVIPIPVLGTIVGALAGTFIGAAGIERAIGRSAQDSVRIGLGATKGRFLGLVSKTGIGLVMFVVTLVAALPLARAPGAVPTTGRSVPATSPAAVTRPSTAATSPTSPR